MEIEIITPEGRKDHRVTIFVSSTTIHVIAGPYPELDTKELALKISEAITAIIAEHD